MYIVVGNDLHLTFCDYPIVREFIKFIWDTQPDVVVIAGDLLDFWALSKFDKTPKSADGVQEELDAGQLFFKTIREHYKGRIIFITGNHEFRLRAFIARQSPELYGLRVLELSSLLNLDVYNVELVDLPDNLSRFTDNFIELDGVYIGHFNMARSASGATAKGLVDLHGGTILQAHTHHGGVFYKPLITGETLVGVENFCLCDINKTFMKNPKWTRGWSIIKDGLITPMPYKGDLMKK